MFLFLSADSIDSGDKLIPSASQKTTKIVPVLAAEAFGGKRGTSGGGDRGWHDTMGEQVPQSFIMSQLLGSLLPSAKNNLGTTKLDSLFKSNAISSGHGANSSQLEKWVPISGTCCCPVAAVTWPPVATESES
ncbi:unnamed protein product [Pleuronectes platessa]|uniref:Uncharacterized protein n=1 Tax=Pleuronectes platessa TaxID=8262 RepID=A0A9N7VZV5_PLEPL|nr:unnamed protein product [Pleuronectes platessa]